MVPKLDTEKLNTVKYWRISAVHWEECVRRLADMGVKITVGALIKRCRRYGSILINGRVSYEPWCAPNPEKVKRARSAWKGKSGSARPVRKSTKAVTYASVSSTELDAIAPLRPTDRSLPVPGVVGVATGGPSLNSGEKITQVTKVAESEGIGQPVPVDGTREKVERVDKSHGDGVANDATRNITAPCDPISMGGSGVIRSGKTKEEQDEILRRLEARSVEATRKLEKEAARLTYDQIVERNEAEMVPIRQAIALDKINATALKPGSVIRGDAKPEKTIGRA